MFFAVVFVRLPSKGRRISTINVICLCCCRDPTNRTTICMTNRVVVYVKGKMTLDKFGKIMSVSIKQRPNYTNITKLVFLIQLVKNNLICFLSTISEIPATTFEMRRLQPCRRRRRRRPLQGAGRGRSQTREGRRPRVSRVNECVEHKQITFRFSV